MWISILYSIQRAVSSGYLIKYWEGWHMGMNFFYFFSFFFSSIISILFLVFWQPSSFYLVFWIQYNHIPCRAGIVDGNDHIVWIISCKNLASECLSSCGLCWHHITRWEQLVSHIFYVLLNVLFCAWKQLRTPTLGDWHYIVYLFSIDSHDRFLFLAKMVLAWSGGILV
jgi:hypothetical protein